MRLRIARGSPLTQSAHFARPPQTIVNRPDTPYSGESGESFWCYEACEEIVFAKGHVHDPMKAVLDGPMAANDRRSKVFQKEAPVDGLYWSVISLIQLGELGDLCARRLDGPCINDPSHNLRTRRRRQRTGIDESGIITRQQSRRHDGILKERRIAVRGRHGTKNGVQRRVRLSLLGEDTKDQQPSVLGLVNEMDLKGKMAAIDRMFTEVVKVELNKPVGSALEGDLVAVGNVHLDGVTVVDDARSNAPPPDFDLTHIGHARLRQIDWRLLPARAA